MGEAQAAESLSLNKMEGKGEHISWWMYEELHYAPTQMKLWVMRDSNVRSRGRSESSFWLLVFKGHLVMAAKCKGSGQGNSFKSWVHPLWSIRPWKIYLTASCFRSLNLKVIIVHTLRGHSWQRFYEVIFIVLHKCWVIIAIILRVFV